MYHRPNNIRARTIKLLEENRSINLHDPGLCKTFLNMTLKEQKTNKLDFIKIKKQKTKNHFYASKDTIKKVKDKNRRIYLQIIHLIKDWYLEYIKNLTTSNVQNR